MHITLSDKPFGTNGQQRIRISDTTQQAHYQVDKCGRTRLQLKYPFSSDQAELRRIQG